MLSPKSIVIVGASLDNRKLNGRPLHFLQRDGYSGRLYAINPKYKKIAGIQCFPDIQSLPEIVDLAIVAISHIFVAETLIQLGKKGIPIALVYSSGYSEIGAEGVEREKVLLAIAKKYNIRICGPNNLGFVNAFEHVTATFSQYADLPPVSGPVAFASQSGAFGTGISALARKQGIGLGYFINTGNDVDITLIDTLNVVVEDPRITVICAYIEGLKDGVEFIRFAQKAIKAQKPFIVTKVGRKPSGIRAATSHTGALAGEDRVFNGVFRQHGVIRARNEEHMLDLVSAFSCCKIPTGNGLGIITMSGGAGVLMADRAEELGLKVSNPTQYTKDNLSEVIPSFGSTANPIDVTAQFIADPELFIKAIKITLGDPGVDCCIIWLQLMHQRADLIVNLLKGIKKSSVKPFIVCWLDPPKKSIDELRAAGVCVIGATERAVDAVAGLIQYGQSLARSKTELQRNLFGVKKRTTLGVPKNISSMDSISFLEGAGVSLVPTFLASDATNAQKIASEIGYPVVLKIESPDILHKSDIGGIRLGLLTESSVYDSATEILASAKKLVPNAKIEGILVQKMITNNVEFVLGIRRDPIFGPIVMFGLGGILVEIFKDVSFASAPITLEQADLMLDSLISKDILRGVRGNSPVNKKYLKKILCDLSIFACSHPEIIELDLNPLVVADEKMVAVDWLIIVD